VNKSKSGLFLMELIIAIAFFAVASAICIQLFASAHRISERSVNMNMAVNHAQSAAEAFKATNGDIDAMAELLNSFPMSGNLHTWYDEDWNWRAPVLTGLMPPDMRSPRYSMVVEMDLTVSPAVAHIAIIDLLREEELYQLTVKRYLLI